MSMYVRNELSGGYNCRRTYQDELNDQGDDGRNISCRDGTIGSDTLGCSIHHGSSLAQERVDLSGVATRSS